MEVAFTEEIKSLRLGAGDEFFGEGILAVTKALLQSGVSYVGGYQGAPVSHLLDVMVQARDLMGELGVHVEACTNEASAAAMLGTSINYPVRGAVTWKSIVGTNVAADALSNLSSPGVMGGALIIVGEDYGEGASVIQERTHAYALKSSIWLLDPRPSLQNIVRMVEQGFALSEATNTPAFLELRIRACHMRGSFICKDNIKPSISTNNPITAPAGFDYDRLAHPPVTFAHEKLKGDVRLPAAQRFIVERGLNELYEADGSEFGIIVQGGLFNNLIRALQKLDLADGLGRPKVSVLCLNVVHPLAPEQIEAFCRDRHVLIVEEGQPEYIEQAIANILRKAGIAASIQGKDVVPMAGELDAEAILRALVRFFDGLGGAEIRQAVSAVRAGLDDLGQRRASASRLEAVPARPPTFCIGCPERPVFSALKQVRETIGPSHIAADIGCHAFATFAPFSMGNSILGYGMSLASAAGVSPLSGARPLAVMGDGGFWHNGLLSGVASNLLNQGDGVLLVMKNGYTSATGTQEVISSPDSQRRAKARDTSATHTEHTIESTLKGMGVNWLRTVHTYRVADMKRTLSEAFTDPEPGLKVIVAEGECQLERQRRVRPLTAQALSRGERSVKTRFGIDANVCSGDHACIRISGCPALGVADSDDPLKPDPVATVSEQCVGCGLCGENAHAATLCPSFYRSQWIRNPGRIDRWRDRLSRRLRQWLATPDREPGESL